jgi:hypothetical protein
MTMKGSRFSAARIRNLEKRASGEEPHLFENRREAQADHKAVET